MVMKQNSIGNSNNVRLLNPEMETTGFLQILSRK